MKPGSASYGAKSPTSGVANTTSFMTETALKTVIDEEEKKCDDKAGLVDVDLKMFEGTDSADCW